MPFSISAQENQSTGTTLAIQGTQSLPKKPLKIRPKSAIPRVGAPTSLPPQNIVTDVCNSAQFAQNPQVCEICTRLFSNNTIAGFGISRQFKLRASKDLHVQLHAQKIVPPPAHYASVHRFRVIYPPCTSTPTVERKPSPL